MAPTSDDVKLEEKKLRMDLLSELKKSMLQLAIIWEDINEKTRPGLVMVVENTVEVVAGEMLSLN